MASVGGESTIELPFAIEQVWEFLVDIEDAPRWQGGLKSLTVTARDDRGFVTAAEIAVDAKARTMHAEVAFTYEPLKRLLVTQISGDLKSIESAWELEDLGEAGTRVRYYVSVDLGRIGLLLRGPLVDVLRHQLAGNRCTELKKALEE